MHTRAQPRIRKHNPASPPSLQHPPYQICARDSVSRGSNGTIRGRRGKINEKEGTSRPARRTGEKESNLHPPRVVKGT